LKACANLELLGKKYQKLWKVEIQILWKIGTIIYLKKESLIRKLSNGNMGKEIIMLPNSKIMAINKKIKKVSLMNHHHRTFLNTKFYRRKYMPPTVKMKSHLLNEIFSISPLVSFDQNSIFHLFFAKENNLYFMATALSFTFIHYKKV